LVRLGFGQIYNGSFNSLPQAPTKTGQSHEAIRNRQNGKKAPSFRLGMSESIVQGWQTLRTDKGLWRPCNLDSGDPCRNDDVLAFMRLPCQPKENIAMNLERRYIVDENNQKIAAQLDIETFEKIENILENYALYQLMLNNSDEEELNLEDAIKHYKNLCDN
jgi:hypothetical protein